MSLSSRYILGIDPGTTVMGYGLVISQGNDLTLGPCGVLRLEKYNGYAIKLKKIFERTVSLIEEFKPDEVALEAPFYGKNIQSMLKLGRAQGVAMAAALQFQIPIFEYAPRKIKQSVTGHGNASKEQVAGILTRLLNLKTKPEFLDATDALAVAVCHIFQRTGGIASASSRGSRKNYSGWADYVKENKGKAKG
ncbi:MAG: crossover junction endodeoxyribonuclease RuvC [Bacteroidetes bacterium RIFCSPLOWO2_02_FULL_36_8]|nr:MAG: crossover junction endodeoxyribonuclease RuvC [Bacteroidetes bacterium RIFCSPLOWO2_02_FULL_36_8]OFY70365.1 MAG: crossover junction endodeoxyribonuclease RuvC [Bacteroidetes bacterium RIFCSPLOWO2_12_FULL_37_12]